MQHYYRVSVDDHKTVARCHEIFAAHKHPGVQWVSAFLHAAVPDPNVSDVSTDLKPSETYHKPNTH